MVKQKVLKLLDGRNVLLQVLDPRVLRTAPLRGSGEELDNDGNITALNYSEETRFEVAKCVEFAKGDKYKIDKIVRNKIEDNPGYHLFIHSLTKSSQFIMPFLGSNRQFFRWNKSFCNCFIGTEASEDYGSSIYLLYRWDSGKDFRGFESELINHEWYTGSWEPDKYHTMYEFCIPDSHEDINNIIKGNYSHVSVFGKEQILNFHNANDDSRLAKILRRDGELRRQMSEDLIVDIPKDNELLSSFEVKEEIYLEKYRIKDERRTEGEIDPELW